MSSIENIEIKVNEYEYSPREYDNLGTIITKHSKYRLGDIEFIVGNNGSLEEYLKKHLNIVEDCMIDDIVYLPIYLYDHSGISIKTTPFSCKWDSGMVGYIYVKKEKARKEFSCKRISQKKKKEIEDILKSEIDIYNEYIMGNIYGYSIKYKDGEIDECCGFIGDSPKDNGMYDCWDDEAIAFYESNSSK